MALGQHTFVLHAARLRYHLPRLYAFTYLPHAATLRFIFIAAYTLMPAFVRFFCCTFSPGRFATVRTTAVCSKPVLLVGPMPTTS